MRLCSISVDLDEIPNYHRIHGLAAPGAATASLVYQRALPRLLEWASRKRLPLTLFCIASDLADGDNAGLLRVAARAGHEVANHSLDHHYDLTRLDRQAMTRQVSEAQRVIAAVTDQRPRGFRAPGYTVTGELLEVLSAQGLDYDSSVFPCPPYYAAKVAALLGVHLRGRRSFSILDTPRVLGAPTRPYRVGTPYYRPGAGLLELPIQVTRGLRLPYIGTALMLAGPRGSRWLTRGVLGEPLVNLELHGVDLLDESDGLAELARAQPDLRVRLSRKLAILDGVVDDLRSAGYAFVALADAAALVDTQRS